jgi:CO dehydrogenase/acetyl-CoA synthase gamma subunit (corrinoid Fe-S protein)
MQIKGAKICGGTLREIVVGGHEAFSKSEGFLGHEPQLMYPIFIGEDVKSKATEWASKNADMVVIEVIKEMPEDVLAENISEILAVWNKAFCIGVPKTGMTECMLSLCGNLRPLINAISYDRLEALKIVEEYGCPVIVQGSSIGELRALVQKVLRYNIEDIVLEVPVYPIGRGFETSLEMLLEIRSLSFRDELLRYPILVAPVSAYRTRGGFKEAELATALTLSSPPYLADILYLGNWRFGEIISRHLDAVYSDVLSPVEIKAPSIIQVGNGGDTYAVTGNWAKTVEIVLDDLERGGVDTNLVVVNTSGYAVIVAILAGILSADKVIEAIRELEIEPRTLIIPGMMRNEQGHIADAFESEVIAGPMDSSQLPTFIHKKERCLNQNLKQ